jgi:hypothetical protein
MITEHTHAELGRRGECPACQSGHVLENQDAPPGCTYYWEHNPIDPMIVCRRHGTTEANGMIGVVQDVNTTNPCISAVYIQKMKENGTYV